MGLEQSLASCRCSQGLRCTDDCFWEAVCVEEGVWDLAFMYSGCILPFLSSVFAEPLSEHGLPRWLSSKESACQCRRQRRCGFEPWVRKIPWRRKWQPSPIFLPGKSHRQRSLVGHSTWGLKDTQLSAHTHTQTYTHTHTHTHTHKHDD